MLGLSLRLALTNLRKNHTIYLPYAIMTVLSTAISYIFASLAFHPQLGQVKGANGVIQVLGFGMIVVMIAVAIMIIYANGFVMKQRSKELGLYSILGLEKKHLLFMNFLENLVFSLLSIFLGLLLGMALDKLFYAILLKAMQMPVILVSTFQLSNVFLVTAYLLAIFFLVNLFNAGKLGMTDSLQLVKDRKSGDKKNKFLWLQTLVGLGLLVAGYTIAQTVTSPISAIPGFFGAVLLVILATYLLFNAGIISWLHWLKKRQTYYYKPANFISISNLVFRMKKNAMGLATITILSTMFLVTLVGGLNIYIGGKDYVNKQNPHDFSLDVGIVNQLEQDQVPALADQLMENTGIAVKDRVRYDYKEVQLSKVTDQTLQVLSEEEVAQIGFEDDFGYAAILDEATYQEMTGQSLGLGSDQIAIFSPMTTFTSGQILSFANKDWQVGQVFSKNPVEGHIPFHLSEVLPKFLILIVKDRNSIEVDGIEHTYLGYTSSLSEEEQVAVQELFLSSTFENQLWSDSLTDGFSSISLGYRAWSIRNYFSFAGSLFFIGLLLSLVFLMATTLVIYFKQISEAHEDRSRFVIMQKVGLDELQTRQSIRKQLLTVFFLPILLAFVHLSFAYKMLSSILLSIGVVNAELILQVTLAICVGYLLVYLLIYAITTGAYKKIIHL
ncbi:MULTISPECIES: FtsX-like permease family protein [unclassified Streptococcus]|uniref:FtsX-like permease family protein n=1 Tax=unclassified Streptococcus TaxID=2608887 RepID=UPI000CF3C39E|nr:FtsX-like permease family protein [Streptococcus suis]